MRIKLTRNNFRIRSYINCWPSIKEYGLWYAFDPNLREGRRKKTARQHYGSNFLRNKKQYKNRLLARDGKRCNICKIPHSTRTLQIDHVQKLSEGGARELITNMQLLCDSCHRLKDNQPRTRTKKHKFDNHRWPPEWFMKFLKRIGIA